MFCFVSFCFVLFLFCFVLFFVFVFAFHILKPLRSVLGQPKWNFSTGKSISSREKIRKNDFAPQKKFPVDPDIPEVFEPGTTPCFNLVFRRFVTASYVTL